MPHSTTSLGLIGLLAAPLVFTSFGCDASGDLVGPEGGVVTSADGRLSVTIRPGALDQEVGISIEAESDGPHDFVGPAYALEPLGLGFSIPITVRYDTQSLAMNDLSMEDVALVVEKEDSWFYLADQRASGRELSASALYLSRFAIVAVPSLDDGVKDRTTQGD